MNKKKVLMQEARNAHKKQRREIPFQVIATPAIDYESIVLKKGQRVPKGYQQVIRLTAADFPSGWPLRRPNHCQCGCGKTYRIGDRVAYRNARETGGYYLTMPRGMKTEPRR